MAKILLNAIGSPVQIQVKKAVSAKTGREYEYLHLVIGEFESRIFFKSQLEKKEVNRVLADGADATLEG